MIHRRRLVLLASGHLKGLLACLAEGVVEDPAAWRPRFAGPTGTAAEGISQGVGLRLREIELQIQISPPGCSTPPEDIRRDRR